VSLGLAQPLPSPDDPDEDDTETVAAPARLYDDALVTVNGKETRLESVLTVERFQTLNIKVERLKPNSQVTVKIIKAGSVFKTRVFDCNHKGELELEVNTGRTKLSGQAELIYTASSGKRHQETTRVVID
jgi:hypothetical protein